MPLGLRGFISLALQLLKTRAAALGKVNGHLPHREKFRGHQNHSVTKINEFIAIIFKKQDLMGKKEFMMNKISIF